MIDEYTVRVPYTWSGRSEVVDHETDINLLAKSPEQAREIAKNAVRAVQPVTEVYSTTILENE